MEGLGHVGRWLRGCVPDQLRQLLPQVAAGGRESSLQATLAGGADGEEGEDEDDIFLDCDTCEATQVCLPADSGATVTC
jgi:hypothetical protein